MSKTAKTKVAGTSPVKGTLHPYTQSLIDFFAPHADAATAEPMSKYMKYHFPFLGLPKPKREELWKAFVRANPLPPFDDGKRVILELWNQPFRELHYIATGIAEKYHKFWDENFHEVLEFLVLNKSWWDTVDTIAVQLAGRFFQKFPELIEPVTQRWMASGNMWLQRTCILFQLSYKEQTDRELLYSLIRQCSESKEFFHQKAIGWALREYSKTEPEEVERFISSEPLKPLSVREGLKWVRRGI